MATKEFEQYLQQIGRTAQGQQRLGLMQQVGQVATGLAGYQQRQLEGVRFKAEQQQKELTDERKTFVDIMKNITEITPELVEWGTGLGIKGLKIGKTPKGLQLEQKQKYYGSLYKGKSAVDLRAVTDDLRQELDRIAPHATYYVPPSIKPQYDDVLARYNAALEQLEKTAGIKVKPVKEEKRIKVREKGGLFKKGKTGTILESEFDSKIYERIE